MRVVVAADCEPVPWANGGGTTRDLALETASSVAAAGGPAFDWRLSLADIDRDGPFSSLPGVDRVFAPVEGAVRLAFEAGPGPSVRRTAAAPPVDGEAVYRADGPPLTFPGEAAPEATLAGGGRCRALNLMLARGRRAGAMRRVALADGGTLDVGWSQRVAPLGVALRACWLQRGRLAVAARVLDPGTMILLEAGDAAPVALGEALLLEIVIGPPGAVPRVDDAVRARAASAPATSEPTSPPSNTLPRTPP